MQNALYIFYLLLTLTSCKQTEKTPWSSHKTEMGKSEVNLREDQWLILQEKYADKRREGIRFFAYGEKPYWEITIDQQNIIRFTSQSQFGDFKAPEVEGMQPQDIDAMIYGGKTKEGILSVMVFPDSCTAGKDEKLPFRLVVSAKRKEGDFSEFRGCGLYLNNPTLHNIWAVKSYSALSANSGVGYGGYLEFNMKTQRIMGNFGCGEIAGNFTPMGDKLKIYGLDYRNKPCEENEVGKELFDHLNFKTHKIVIEGLDLKLIHELDTVRLIKAD